MRYGRSDVIPCCSSWQHNPAQITHAVVSVHYPFEKPKGRQAPLLCDLDLIPPVLHADFSCLLLLVSVLPIPPITWLVQSAELQLPPGVKTPDDFLDNLLRFFPLVLIID